MVKKSTDKKRQSGSEYVKENALKVIAVTVTEAEQLLIRQAAGIAGHGSMAEFSKNAAIEAAKKVIEEFRKPQ